MGELLASVRELSFPRFPGSDGERRAADIVAGRFANLGLDVIREPFTTSRSAVHRYRLVLQSLAAAGALAIGALAPFAPLAAGLVTLTLVIFARFAGGWPRFIESGFDRGPMLQSENVVARRAAPGEAPVRFVVLAHLDSKSARWPTLVPVAVILLSLLAIVVLGIWSLLAALRGAQPPPAWLSLPLGFVVAGGLLLMTRNTSGDESPGAMDNASGLAVLLEAARALPADPALSEAELVFLATGAEEIGLAGAVHWLRAHAAGLDKRRTVFVNVDSVGCGRGLLALAPRGFAPGGRSMRSVIRAAGRAAGVPVRQLAVLPGVGVDTMPIAARGFASVTLLGQVLGRAAARVHSARDEVSHLGEGGLRDAADVVHEIARDVVRRSPR